MAAQQSANEEWSEERTMKLIEVFKNNETLWKKSHATYFNHYIKPHAWEEVALTMNSTPEICMYKIKILKAKWYRDREKKIKYDIARGVDPEVARNKETYLTPLTKALHFLKENEIKVIKKDSVVINAENNQSSSITSQVPKLDKGIIDLLKVKQKRSLLFKKKNIGGKRAGKRNVSKITMDNNAPQKIARISENNKSYVQNTNNGGSQGNTMQNQREGPSVDSENEIKYFSKFIAAKLKKYTKMTKNTVEHEICEILFKADQNYFEMPSEDFEIDLDNSLELVSDARRDVFQYDECDVVVD